MCVIFLVSCFFSLKSSEKGAQARNEILPVYICCHLVVMLLYDMVWILFWLFCDNPGLAGEKQLCQELGQIKYPGGAPQKTGGYPEGEACKLLQ